MKRPVQGNGGERLYVYVLPLFLYLLLIFALSSVSGCPEVLPDIFSLDKFIHTVEYYILGYLLMRVLVTSSHGLFAGAPAIFAVACGVLYAISDEWHQSFVPGRFASVYDLLFDMLGVVVAVVSYRFVRYRVRWIRNIEDGLEGGRQC